MRTRTLRCCVVLLLIGLLAGPLQATWSIIIVNTLTREVVIGCATCLTGYDLEVFVPVVRVGRGGACAQSYVDTTGANRIVIWNGLQAWTPPASILAMLAAQDPGHQTRQYGFVDVLGNALGFTGNQAGPWAGHLTGQNGALVWAIQGNVLTGQPVLQMAEQAILTTTGDLPAKLMAAMLAAQSMGGDGRCSCNPSAPAACGSPPASFTKSSHIAFMIAARLGDTDGVCNASLGCSTGSYFMDLNVAFQSAAAPDPVLQLQSLFNTWRNSWTGRPDHHQSTLSFAHLDLPADGQTQTTATLVLRDWQGTQLTTGNATVTVNLDPSSTATPIIGPVSSLGGAVYTFPLTASPTPGVASFQVIVDDGQGPILLSPLPNLVMLSDSLWVSTINISAAAGGTLDLVLHAGSLHAGRSYLLLASQAGFLPGIPISPTLTLPLNPDPLFFAVFDLAIAGQLPGFAGPLDASGRATASVVFPPNALSFPSGVFSFAYGLLNPIDFTSNARVVGIGP